MENPVIQSLRDFPNSLIYSSQENKRYSELYEIVERYCKEFESFGLTKGNSIIIAADKSVYSLAAIIACIKSGIIYIPVDYKSPNERLKYICKASGAHYIFDNEGNFNPIEGKTNSNIHEECACILFTSGSTGTPKGVMLSNKNILSFVNWAIKEFNVSTSDTLTSIAPFHFDLSVFDIFAALLSGANLWLINDSEASNPKWIKDKFVEIKPSIVYATPSWLSLQLQYESLSNKNSPRLVLFAGEVFPIEKFSKLKQTWKTTFYNLYGPTESNVCTYYKLPENQIPDPIPIGVTCPYAKTDIDSSTGELIISGESLMLGYLENTLGPFDSYKSGDKVTVDENGDLVFVGRLDRMIKRNGFRIEPAEIETTLIKKPGILSCAVIYSNNKLIAFYTGEKTSLIELKKFCSENLLSYMIPNTFTYMDSLPLNNSHKIDYGLLESQA